MAEYTNPSPLEGAPLETGPAPAPCVVYLFGGAAQLFIEMRLPTDVSFGAVGGCGWMSKVVVTGKGNEFRYQGWGNSLGRWVVGYKLRQPGDWAALNSFHRLVQGKAIGFRFRDWTDYTDEAGPGTGIRAGVVKTNAKGALALYKRYSIANVVAGGSYTADRPVFKPVLSGLSIYDSTGVTLRTGWAVNQSTGVVTTAGTVIAGDQWRGNFDVPVRFDTDEQDANVVPGAVGWQGVPLTELRMQDSAS